MKKITFLPHTADICIKLEADSLEELFAAGMEGLNNVLHHDHGKHVPSSTIHKTISIESPDTTALLIDFLSEVLTLSYEKKAYFSDLTIIELTPTTLKATLAGGEVDQFGEDIKAVTYHEAEVKKSGGKVWETNVIFDI